MKLWKKILIGFGLGVLAGFIFQESILVVKPFGDLFIRLIRMIIVPLVFASLVVGASSMSDMKKLGRVGAKTIGYYLTTTVFAVTLGVVIANIIQPGRGLVIDVEEVAIETRAAPDVVETLLNLVPLNPLAALVEGRMLQIIVFALFVGITIALIGEKGKPVYDFFDSFAEVMYRITEIVMNYAPIGVFALIAWVVGTHGLDVLLPLAKVIFAVYLACLLHAGIIYSLANSLLAKIHPLRFFRGFFDAWIVAFTTCSSAATLPVTIRCAKKAGVPGSIRNFVLPLGATINMDGTAIYQGIGVLFIAQAYGISLTFAQHITIVLTATLASIGTAGVPGAGMIMLVMMLTSVGLPLDGIALIAGIDRVLDMVRTSVNVLGDGTCAMVVAATEGELQPVSEVPGAEA